MLSNNKQFTSKLINICKEILEAGNEVQFHGKNVRIYERPFKELADLLESRFNIKYEVIESKSTILATYPPFNSVGSAITSLNYKEIIREIDDENLTDLLKKNDKVFKEDLGFYIDYKNLEIIYKGKNKFNATIIINPGSLVSIGANEQELAAMLLHEVGHDFEFLRYEIYLTRKGQQLLDEINKSLKEEKSLDKIIEIIYKFENKSVDVEELSLPEKLEIIFTAPSKLFEVTSKEYFERFNLSNNIVTGKEFENMADRFVKNFDLSHFLPSGLNKIMMYYRTRENIYGLTIGKFLLKKAVRQIMISESFIKGFMIALGFRIVAFLIYNFIYVPIYDTLIGDMDSKKKESFETFIRVITRFYALYIFIIQLLTLPELISSPVFFAIIVGNMINPVIKDYIANYREKDTKALFPYEDPVKRIEAIKRDLISELKEIDDVKTKKEILEKINTVEKELKKTKQLLGRTVIEVSRLGIITIPYSLSDPNSLNPMYVLTNLINEHVNNDLYVRSAELEINHSNA